MKASQKLHSIRNSLVVTKKSLDDRGGGGKLMSLNLVEAVIHALDELEKRIDELEKRVPRR